MSSWTILREILVYFTSRKRRWLLPLVIVLLILGVLIIAGSSSVLAPFIYTLF